MVPAIGLAAREQNRSAATVATHRQAIHAHDGRLVPFKVFSQLSHARKHARSAPTTSGHKNYPFRPNAEVQPRWTSDKCQTNSKIEARRAFSGRERGGGRYKRRSVKVRADRLKPARLLERQRWRPGFTVALHCSEHFSAWCQPKRALRDTSCIRKQQRRVLCDVMHGEYPLSWRRRIFSEQRNQPRHPLFAAAPTLQTNSRRVSSLQETALAPARSRFECDTLNNVGRRTPGVSKAPRSGRALSLPARPPARRLRADVRVAPTRLEVDCRGHFSRPRVDTVGQ